MNIYYEPNEEEFKIGFEYESLQDERFPDEKESWSKEKISDKWALRTFIGYYCGDHIADLRVKKIDIQDIESLGFKLIETKCINIPKQTHHVLNDGNFTVQITEENFEVTIWKSYETSKGLGGTLRFSGIVKSKNTLFEVLEMVKK